jgi:hypothetical protein
MMWERRKKDIGRAAEDGFKGDTTADYAVCLIRNIARTALEGEVRCPVTI